MVLRGALEDACVQRGTSYKTSWVSEERVEFRRGIDENPIVIHKDGIGVLVRPGEKTVQERGAHKTKRAETIV